MKTYNDYVDYFENLAIHNVDITHDPANNKKGFFRMGIEEILSGSRTDINTQGIVMDLVNYQYKPGMSGGDNRKHVQGGFAITSFHKTMDFNGIQKALNDSENVIDTIIKRIRYDSLTSVNDENSFWYGSQDVLKNFHVIPMNYRGALNYSGFLVTFDFSNHFDLCVDHLKWADLSFSDVEDPNSL